MSRLMGFLCFKAFKSAAMTVIVRQDRDILDRWIGTFGRFPVMNIDALSDVCVDDRFP
ncbi:hypothetical protein BN2476_1220002 [Paraburkholderia piptadeniae]|uniref:Uncharacterized protein n=1 Tax=Paraburkholderia piptadeniae TaxID=1701573 RepID=A0A1N7SVS4_9BURK|nr:hypothetical protein BN2476_1220002 [Paraburkholderia piptadeniae]